MKEEEDRKRKLQEEEDRKRKHEDEDRKRKHELEKGEAEKLQREDEERKRMYERLGKEEQIERSRMELMRTHDEVCIRKFIFRISGLLYSRFFFSLGAQED